MQQRLADAERYTKEQEATALVLQLKMVQEAMGGNSELAAQYLLEQRKLDHLSSIARGTNNSTYFLPEGDKVLSTLFPRVKSMLDTQK
jgi:hypothetical protein